MSKKVVIKFSGEFITGQEAVNLKKALKVAETIAVLKKQGYKIGVVIGAGNIFRGRSVANKEFSRIDADYIGMIGSVVNGLALKVALDALKIKNRLESTFIIQQAVEPHNPAKAKKFFNQGEVIIFAGGTGLPYFSTDIAAVELALELEADMLYKATKVSGVFDKDPKRYKGAKKYTEITFQEAIDKKLQVIDQTALALAQTNNLPIYIFKWQSGALAKLVTNQLKGTLVKV